MRGVWIQYGIVLGQDSFGERWNANVVVCATPRTTYCTVLLVLCKQMWNCTFFLPCCYTELDSGESTVFVMISREDVSS